MPARIPSLRLHRPSGQGVTILGGKDFYCGKHGTPEAEEVYRRLLAEWLATGGIKSKASAPIVNDLILAFWRHAESFYRDAEGKPSAELANLKLALKPLRRLYGTAAAGSFGPVALKAVRQQLIDDGLSIRTINQRINRIIRVFRHGVESELVPADLHLRLKAVESLRKGRSGAKESRKVGPVPDVQVDAVFPHVSRQVRAMIELQRLTGMRSGEIIIMRTCDIDRSGKVWRYSPSKNKNMNRGKDRAIFIGPKGQEILAPWLRPDPSGFLFRPVEALAEIRAERRAKRKTRVQPSQRDRSKAKPARTPGDRYTTASYGSAIAKACLKAGIPHWHPHQLRHSNATKLRSEFGIDAARVILGHGSATTSEIYAAADFKKGEAIMSEVG